MIEMFQHQTREKVLKSTSTFLPGGVFFTCGHERQMTVYVYYIGPYLTPKNKNILVNFTVSKLKLGVVVAEIILNSHSQVLTNESRYFL